ncbi:thy-1 membrane glycoprotein isoform X2 [Clupea harengus]|nr:thy-1 membrane glycoprotein isoform X2 [Clupea harengus]XP_042564500.1 thy-1 membrane glycoprotein isoform X2 [Clupea harengus]
MNIIGTLCLLGLATAQTITDLTSCITKENNLKMECNFNPAASASPPPMCKFTQGNKIVGSTDRAEEQDATYRHRANVTIKASVCELYLTGLSDNAQDFKCTIKQTEMKDKTARVVRKEIPTCSAALSILLQKGTGLFFIFMTLPLLSELI